LRYTALLAPRISARGEEGFSSCLVHPCRRAVATTPPVCPAASVRLQRSMLPSPVTRGLGHWSSTFRGHLCLYFRYGPTTRSPSFKMALSMDSQSSVSLPLAIQATGLLTFAPVGLIPLNTPAFRDPSATPKDHFLDIRLYCPGPSTLNRPHPSHWQARSDFPPLRLYETPRLCGSA